MRTVSLVYIAVFFALVYVATNRWMVNPAGDGDDGYSPKVVATAPDR